MSNTPIAPSTPLSGAKAPSATPRVLSLDALRGFDMFWIMSGEQIVHALARTTGWPVFTMMSDQLHHTVWNGFTFYDMIFPLFLFIAGAALPFSVTHQLRSSTKKQVIGRMLRRTLILVLLGLVVNGALRFNGLENTRFPSVLARIGIAWFFAGLIYLGGGLRWQISWLIGLLLGYWAIMVWVPVPGFGAGVLTMQGSLESYIDRLLLPGRLHDGIHDPRYRHRLAGSADGQLPAMGFRAARTIAIHRLIQRPISCMANVEKGCCPCCGRRPAGIPGLCLGVRLPYKQTSLDKFIRTLCRRIQRSSAQYLLCDH